MIGDLLRNQLSSDMALLVAGRAANYALTKVQLVNLENQQVSGVCVFVCVCHAQDTCIQDIKDDIISATRTALVCLSFLQSKGETG